MIIFNKTSVDNCILDLSFIKFFILFVYLKALLCAVRFDRNKHCMCAIRLDIKKTLYVCAIRMDIKEHCVFAIFMENIACLQSELIGKNKCQCA